MRQLLLQNGCQYVFEGKMETNSTDIKFSIAKQTNKTQKFYLVLATLQWFC